MKEKDIHKEEAEKFHYRMWNGRLSEKVIAEIKRRQANEKSVNILFEKLLGIRKK